MFVRRCSREKGAKKKKRTEFGNIGKIVFAGSVRAASGNSGAAVIVTARRDARHHDVGIPRRNVIVGDVPELARLADLSGLHERAGIRGAGV